MDTKTQNRGRRHVAAMPTEITKVGLAVIDGERLLLVRKRGSDFLILPGGKPERNESDAETLSRELAEELGCGVISDQLKFLGTFSDEAAGMPGVRVTIKLYAGGLIGTPIPHAEIESIVWWTRTALPEASLAPSLRNSILPFLHKLVVERNQEQRLRKAARP
jgi:8-oxo-dGTP diphosphatase